MARKSILITMLLLALFRVPAVWAYQISGGIHDRWPDFVGFNVKGTCNECHRMHMAPEPNQWVRDLTPDATLTSDLCLDCHGGAPPGWASTARDTSTVETSLHDFTNEPLSPDGSCPGCHDLHYPDETTAAYAGSASGHFIANNILWARDISGELGTEFEQKRDLATNSDPTGGPNYVVGMTIFCYDCHGGAARHGIPDDFDFNENPQDIAFGGDRDINGGNVGYYELPDGEEPGVGGVQAPSLAAILASPSDPDLVPGGHYVQSLMNSDGSQVDDNYEVRDPVGRLLYRISVGDKLPCELCHDPHLKPSTSSTSPPDEVFFRRDIHVGEGSSGSGLVINRSSETYFSNRKFLASDDTRNGTGGPGSGRRMCIYCHGTGDWDGNQNYLTGVSPLIVNWTDRTTIYGIQIRTVSTPNGSTAFPPPSTVGDHFLDATRACTSCHKHNNVKSANCAACHAYPPTRGAHEKHAQTQLTGGLQMTCDVCHGLGAPASTHAGHNEGDGTVQSANITLLGMANYETKYPSTPRPSWYDSTWGTNGVATWTTLSDVTCRARCHGNESGSADGDAPLSWYDTADSPTYNNVCFYCHNTVVSSFQLPGTSGTVYQATNAASNYVGPISGFSRGGHGDSGINDPAWFRDTAPGSSVPLACVACHDESQEHFPVQAGNPYRASDIALSNNLPGRSLAEGPLTNLCTKTNCHPKVLGAGDYGFLSAIKHPSDHWPIASPLEILLDAPAAQINQESAASTTSPAYDPFGRAVTVGLHIDRYVDHWGYWGAVSCTATAQDDDPFMPLGDSLIKQVGDDYNNDNGTPVNEHRLITCITCHNPHGTDLYVSGQGCAQASTLTEIPANKMLRLRDQDGEMCAACHE